MTTMQRPHTTPTNLDVLRRRYAHGELSLGQYEQARDALLAAGTHHDPAPHHHGTAA
jgi:uncharacterized membrane protein